MSRGSLSDNGEPHQEAIRWNMLFPEKQQPVPILFHKDCSEEMHTITHSQFEKLCFIQKIYKSIRKK